MQKRSDFKAARRVVIKIGSALLTGGGRGLDLQGISDWVSQMADLSARDMEVVLVSSGSVAEGMNRLGWSTRPHALHELQAAASVGQMGLVRAYESLFEQHGRKTAQILLTHDDLSHRHRYLNARSTLLTLLKLGVVPVINENDTVATEEIRFGDNDTLGAMVANLIDADLLIILTDQKGLYERDPTVDPTAQLVSEAHIDDPSLGAMVGESRSGLGRGGMITKLRAARLASRSGTATVILSGKETNGIPRVIDGETLGTFLVPDASPLLARKRWLAGQLKAKGQLTIDAGAARVLKESGKSLLPIGVTQVTGEFDRGDLVICLNIEGEEVARGLVNYSSEEAARLIGQPTHKIEEVLGYVDEPEMIHRDNLIVA
jgi:glutamate 5-kinase